MKKALPYFIGPVIGVALLGLAVVLQVGPGAFFFALIFSPALVLLAPPVQYLLLRHGQLTGQPIAAGILASGLIICIAIGATFTGVFDFW